MITFNPSLTLNIGKRSKDGEKEKPNTKPSEPQSTAPAAPLAQVGKIDLLLVLLLCLGVALVFLSAAVFVYAARH